MHIEYKVIYEVAGGQDKGNRGLLEISRTERERKKKRRKEMKKEKEITTSEICRNGELDHIIDGLTSSCLERKSDTKHHGILLKKNKTKQKQET